MAKTTRRRLLTGAAAASIGLPFLRSAPECRLRLGLPIADRVLFHAERVDQPLVLGTLATGRTSRGRIASSRGGSAATCSTRR